MNKGGYYQVAGAHIITKFSKTSSHETIYIYIYVFCFVYKLTIFDAFAQLKSSLVMVPEQ
jgi:hypothetical protein